MFGTGGRGCAVQAATGTVSKLDPVRPGSPGRPIDGLPEYGWRLRLRFAAWVRDQVKFGSVDELLEQMGRDCARVREIVAGGARQGKEAVCR